MKNNLFCLILLLSTYLPGLSQSYWDGFSVPMPSSAYFLPNAICHDLVVTSNGTYLMATVGTGIQKSTNSGLTWTAVNTGGELNFRAIEMDASGNVWATTSSGSNRLFKSTDGGDNFSVVAATFANTSYFNILRALANGRIIVGTTFGPASLQISSNATGTSFSAISTSFGASILDVETDSNNAIYVSGNGTSGWIMRSTDLGATFTLLSLPGPAGLTSDFSIQGNKIVATSSNGIYLSQNLGSTWASIRGNLTESTLFGYVRFDANGNLFFMNTNFQRTFISTNSGGLWTQLSAIRPYMTLTAFSFEVVFKSASEWTLVSNPGVVKTFDGGKNWQSGPQTNPTTFSDVFVSSNDNIFVAAPGANGFSVKESGNADATSYVVGQGNTSRPITGFIESNGALYAYGSTGIIRAAISGARTAQNYGVQNTQAFSNLTSIGSVLYSISGTNLLTSTDFGTNWTTTTITGFSGSITKVLASKSASLIFFQSGSLLYTLNPATGAASLVSSLPSTVLDFAVGSNALWVLTSTTSLRRSTDNGATFITRVLPNSFAGNRVWAVDDQFVVTRSSTNGVNALNVSINGGTFWTQRALLNSGTGVSVTGVAFTPTGNIVCVVNNGGNTSLHRSVKSAIPPLAPANLRVTGSSPATPIFTYPQSGSFEFTMDDKSNNEEYFLVQRSTDNVNWDSVTYELPENFTQKRVFHSNQPDMVQGTLYYYRVQAVNSAGRSAFSNVVSATLTPYCVSTIPDNRSWTAVVTPDPGYTASTANVTNSNITIQKNAGSDDRFTLLDYSFGIVPTPPINGRSIFPANAVTIQENCGVVNFFLVGNPAANPDIANGLGTWNATTGTLTVKWQTPPRFNSKWYATTVYTLNAADPVPEIPVLNGYVYSSTEVFLAWNQVNFATKYIIEKSTDFGATYTPLVSVNYPITSFIDKNLTQGTTHYYRIKAKHEFGPGGNPSESAWSTEIAVQLGNTIFRPIESDLSQNLDNQQGSSWGDFDGDGDEDIVLCTFNNIQGQNVPPSFFENVGNAQFKRKPVEIVAGDFDAVTRAAGVMDFNNDGKLDIYFDRAGSANDFVLINTGSWQFSKLQINENTPGASIENLAMADYDKDGYVDFYVGTADTGSTPPSLPNYLIKNTGGTSTTQITTGSVVTDLTGSRSVSFADYDNDGDQDLLVLNFQSATNTPVQPQILYKNNGDGTFTRVTGLIFDTDLVPQVRTSSWGDIDNDGDLDLFLGSQAGVNFSNNANYTTDRLYRNDGGIFTNISSVSSTNLLEIGDEYGTITFGSTFGDIDNDGDLDLLVSNQGVEDYRGESAIFRNDGTGKFTKEITDELFTNKYVVTAGISIADVDKDGFLDVYPVKGSQFGSGWPGDNIPNLIYKSTLTSSSSRNWLQVKLIGIVSNKAAIGARVTVVTTSPGRSQIREVAGMTGYGSQNSLIQHFGLGTATTSTITVRWPSGIVQTLTGVASNQFITITEDNKGPAVTTISPANNAKAVALNSKLEITFDEVPIPVAGKKVSLFLASNLTTPIQAFDANAGVITNNTIVFTPATALTPTTVYKVVIDEGAYKDPYNNLGTYTSLLWQFTSLDLTAPVFGNPAVTFQALVSKGFSANTFNVSVTDNVSIASLIMSYRGAGTTDAFTDLTGIFNAATNQWDFAVSETLYNSTGLEFYFTAKDPDNNSTRHPSANNLQSLFETTPPVISVIASPPIVAKGFGLQTFKVLATDNFGVASIKMFHRNTKDGVNYTELAGTLDAQATNQYNFTLAESAFNGAGIEYYFTAADATGNQVQAPLATDNPATLKMLIDVVAPTLTGFTPPVSITKANTTFTIKVSDNLGVDAVVMKYRGIASKAFATSAPGVKNAAGDYEFAVSGDWIDNMGIEYYFRAVDASKNIGVNPDTTAATNKYHKTFIELEGGNRPKLSLIKGSTGASGYQIISVPLELTNKNIADNFDELGTADKTAYRFLRYRSTPTPGWDEYPGGGLSVLNRGEGYFLNSLKAEEITLLDGVAPQFDQSNFFSMNLKKGWNQIGNPYTVQIQWSDVLSYNKNPAGVGKLVKYDNGYNTNDPDGIVEPYKGGFVQVDNDITLKIPFRGFTTGGRSANIDSDLSRSNWELPFALTQDGLSYQVGMIGMNEAASLSKDNFDLPVVPRLNEFIEASFDHPEHFMKKFSQDVVPTFDEHTWDFAVASNMNGEATITWNNLALGENDKELFLLDLNRQQLVNMRTTGTYTFDPKQSDQFRIYFGTNLEKKIQPSRVIVGKAFPNPTSGVTSIAFSLPEQNTATNVSLEVFDLMGKKIATLVKGVLAPGFYVAEWDTTMNNVAEGLYVCRLIVAGEEKQEIVSEKIVVKR